jgi:hypothetical protein
MNVIKIIQCVPVVRVAQLVEAVPTSETTHNPLQRTSERHEVGNTVALFDVLGARAIRAHVWYGDAGSQRAVQARRVLYMSVALYTDSSQALPEGH